MRCLSGKRQTAVYDTDIFLLQLCHRSTATLDRLYAQAAAAQMAAMLAKDAFLVFRALCKLSIRTADATTHTDLTALRGKVRRPTRTIKSRRLRWKPTSSAA